MVPEIDTGGGGFSGSSSSGATSGNSGDTSTNSADRVSKQFINMNTQGAKGLDLNGYLGATNAGFYQAIMGEQAAETAQARPVDRWLPYAALGVVAALGFGFLMMMGRD